MSATPMKPIPIAAGRDISRRYGYDQVVIIARRVGDDPAPRGEHVTTYGVDTAHCAVAARMGYHIRHKIMQWPEPGGSEHDREDAVRFRAMAQAMEAGEGPFLEAMEKFPEPKEGAPILETMRAMIDAAMAAAKKAGQ